MKSVEAIQKEITRIEADNRYISGLKHPATLPIQLKLETRLNTLKWVLKE